MSGGFFDYKDDYLKSEIFGFDDEPRNVFEDREISHLVFDVLTLVHDFDWYKSGDTCEETYLERKEAFKKKWFGKRSARMKQTIDDALDDLRTELYKTYGIFEEE